MAPPTPRDRDPRPSAEPTGSAADVLASLLTDAHARGVVEGLEMLGVGAVLIDAAGMVLQVGRRGQRLMAGWIRIVAAHLVAERPEDERALAALIGGAIAGRPSPSGIRLRAGIDGPVLTLRAVPVPGAGGPRTGAQAAIVLDEA